LIQLALYKGTQRTYQRDKSEGAHSAEQQLGVTFALALEAKKQTQTKRGAKPECQIEIEHH
jgi:hypothetical protein